MSIWLRWLTVTHTVILLLMSQVWLLVCVFWSQFPVLSIYLSLFLSLTLLLETAGDASFDDDVSVCQSVCVCVWHETSWQASSHPYRANQLFLCFDKADLCECLCVCVCVALQMSPRWSFEHMALRRRKQGRQWREGGNQNILHFQHSVMEAASENKCIHSHECFLPLCFHPHVHGCAFIACLPFSFHSSHVHSDESLLEGKCKLASDWGGGEGRRWELWVWGREKEEGDWERQWLTDYSTLLWLHLLWLDEFLVAFCSSSSSVT